ncbi:MAG: HAD family hydrolase [Dehalococcoidia bacterium]
MTAPISTNWRDGIRLLTFDLDDTLIDTDGIAPERVADAIEVARTLLGPDAVDYEAVHAAVVATNPVSPGRAATMLRLLGVDPTHEYAARIREAYGRRLVDLVRPFPETIEVLTALRERVRIGIVSNGPETLQGAKLARCGLAGLVDVVVFSGAFGVDKPDARIFAHACALAGVAVEAAAHVGDSVLADIAGARAAGMHTIWRRPPHREEPVGEGAPPDLVIDELRELLDLFPPRLPR